MLRGLAVKRLQGGCICYKADFMNDMPSFGEAVSSEDIVVMWYPAGCWHGLLVALRRWARAERRQEGKR